MWWSQYPASILNAKGYTGKDDIFPNPVLLFWTNAELFSTGHTCSKEGYNCQGINLAVKTTLIPCTYETSVLELENTAKLLEFRRHTNGVSLSLSHSFILNATVFIACLSSQNNSWKNINKINKILFRYIGKCLHDTQLSHVSYDMGRLPRTVPNLIIFERNMQTAQNIYL